MSFFIKQNDTSPAFRALLKDADDNAVDVTGATVRFHMTEKNGTVVVDAAATINDGPTGDVQYNWDAADTVSSGRFRAEFEVTYADSTIETFPNHGYESVLVDKDLA